MGNLVEESTAYTAWSTAYPLPTACFSYDPTAESYAPPTAAAAAEASGSSGGDAKTGSAAGAGARNPFEAVFGKGVGRIKGTVLLMAVVFMGFGAL